MLVGWICVWSEWVAMKEKRQETVVGLISVHPPRRRLLLATPVLPDSLHEWLAAPPPEIPARFFHRPTAHSRTRILAFK